MAPIAEAADWSTHTMTGALGVAAGAVLTFVSRWRKQSSDDWGSMVKHLAARVDMLEKSVSEVQKEHIRCLESQADLRARLSVQDSTTLRMHEENKARFDAILSRLPAPVA